MQFLVKTRESECQLTQNSSVIKILMSAWETKVQVPLLPDSDQRLDSEATSTFEAGVVIPRSSRHALIAKYEPAKIPWVHTWGG